MPDGTEPGRKTVRQLDIRKHHVIQQRRVAEQHVEQLPGIAAAIGTQHRRHREADPDLGPAVANIGNALDRADDAIQDGKIVDRLQRHLDALLDGDGSGAGFY